MTARPCPRIPRRAAAPPPGDGARHRWLPAGLGVLLVGAVAGLDYAVGTVVSVHLLYVVVVLVIGWVGCRRHAVAAAVLAAAASLATHLVKAGGEPPLPIVWHALTDMAVLALMAVLLDSLYRALDQQRQLAEADSLTGALNRRAFEIAAERERRRASRQGTPLSLAYLDVDHFKRANDRLGHHAGDRVLEAVAAAIARTVRATDLFARMGGDEFVLLLPETDAREAMTVVQRVRAVTAAAARAAGYPVALSAGIATFRAIPASVDAMLAAADDLLYKAKESGRDRVVGAVAPGPWAAWDTAALPSRAGESLPSIPAR